MKVSIYRSAFNLIENGFVYWQDSIRQSCEFADEVIIAVNKSKDNTLEEIQKLGFDNLKIIDCDISYSDPLLDGKLKNEALQNCSGDILIQLDLDEYIPSNQKKNWIDLCQQFLNQDYFQSLMIPSVNLYGSWEKYKDITPKWYIHKKGFFRGPVKYAVKKDGTIDTKISDGCELIDYEGKIPTSALIPKSIEELRKHNIFVVHFGYLDFNARLERNKKFWSNHWLLESGGDLPAHKIHESLSDFDTESQQHNLQI